MNADTPYLDPAHDTDVAWARRKEATLAALKMFRMVLDAVRRHSEWVESRHGISAVDLWALWELTQTPGLRPVDLAKAMAMPRSGAEQLLDGLLRRGLVRREPAPENGGVSVYFPTFDGQRIADASPQYGQGVLKAAMGQLGDASLGKLVRAMSDLVEHLPFREERAALQPMAELLRPGGAADAASRNDR
ncbi:MAG: winged helix-turn-helix transcriptional regulator [Betaproteobacteria bacterium]|nr:winged helix-turn-helix transcriptional regulator [Betaproteobacteria bacterium]